MAAARDDRGGEEASAALLTVDEAEGIAAQWDALAARAIEPNVFLCRWWAMAGLRHLPEARDGRVVAAWREAGGERRLVGLMLVIRAKGRHANPFGVLRAVESYAPLSTPLLDPERPAETLSAMLSALAASGAVALALPHLRKDDRVTAALREAAAASAMPLVALASHRRAFLRSPLTGAEYIRATLQRRRRREANRQRNRLGEMGALRLCVARGEREVASALDAFIVLEGAGWKGRAGTALSKAPGGAAFFRAVAAAGAPTGHFRVAALLLGDRTIAAGLVAVAGRRAFYVKTAYEEALGRYSPGYLLTIDLTEDLLDDPGIDDADSVADADHPLIDRVWSGRSPIESVLVGTRPGRGAVFMLALAVERSRHAAIGLLKATLQRLRRRPASH